VKNQPKEKAMRGFDYARLEQITRIEKPFRGTTNRFPLGSRKANLKNFYVREEDGVKVFDITCDTRWASTKITKEEYLAAKAANKKNVHEYTNIDGIVDEYIQYDHPVHILGTSYPDGYFQFNADPEKYAYGQGEKKFLSDATSGWFKNDSRRGGMVWSIGRSDAWRMMPIFKNMRVTTDQAMRSLDEYSVIGRKVNRKVGKDVLAGYEHFYKVSETMCKAMDRDAFLRTAKEVLDEHKGEHDDFACAEALRDQAPLDAMILYATAMGIGRIQNQIVHPNWHRSEPHEIFENLKRHMNTRIYKEHPEVFKLVRYGMDEKYPPSVWGYEIEVNGEIVQQY
jgi:hypothetical protein